MFVQTQSSSYLPCSGDIVGPSVGVSNHGVCLLVDIGVDGVGVLVQVGGELLSAVIGVRVHVESKHSGCTVWKVMKKSRWESYTLWGESYTTVCSHW